ncbi:MAG: NAD(P)-dependent alcohol dehydrogenase [Bdellovibrionota bacterium]
MISTKAYAAYKAKEDLKPFQIQRREIGENDILIKISYCGVCHSDLHEVRGEWGEGTYPLVPGHEIVGHIKALGAKVKNFKIDEPVGVGCFVDSCRTCFSCKDGLEQYCEVKTTFTYNSFEKDGKTLTYGGYSDQIVVDQNYVLHISPEVDLAKTAPLLCAGITTYSPLRQWKVGKGHKLAVLGLGGLGHMAIKLGASLGAEVTVLSSSEKKKDDALKLGAKHFVSTQNPQALKAVNSSFDFIIDTVSAPHDLNMYLNLLKRDGTMILLGVPEKAEPLRAGMLIGKRRRLAGSLIGGIKETQEMLDYCAKNKITSDVEVISMDQINIAYERMLKSDVKYRFVIDMKTL